MKMCPNFRNQINDEAVYCPICGTGIGAAPQYSPQQTPPPAPEYNTGFNQPPVYAPPVPYVDPYDHTEDFDAKDISENKVIAMLVYLMGPLGIVIALLAANGSKYAAFHVKQAMKLTVAEILAVVALVIVAYIMWGIHLRALMFFVVAAALIGLAALHLICFLQVCKGKAKEVYIVRSLRFLK